MTDKNRPLRELTALGQSVWLDYIRRGMLESGELATLIRDHSVRGVTSNPTIFEQAIGGSEDYDDALEDLAAAGATAGDAFEKLAIQDIQRAADLFRAIYDESGGADGFVSLEVSPELAHDTQATLEEARRLWAVTDRPNLMVKVPGTPEGIPAIEQLLSEGVNVNVTLLFSLEGYERVMEAYLAGLERRVAAGQPVDRVASVASFFVSRVDTAIDAELEARIRATTDPREADRLRALRGKAAIANAKLAYRRFQEIFGGERFTALRARGARVQRPLWASTSTKNPEYRDVIYVEELIGPDTVNTMPLATVHAFADHGEVTRTVDADLDGARADLAALEQVGIELARVTQQRGVRGTSTLRIRLDHEIGRSVLEVAHEPSATPERSPVLRGRDSEGCGQPPGPKVGADLKITRCVRDPKGTAQRFTSAQPIGQVRDADLRVLVSAGEDLEDILPNSRAELQRCIAQQLVPTHCYVPYRIVVLVECPVTRRVPNRRPVGTHVIERHRTRGRMFEVADELTHQPCLLRILDTTVHLDHHRCRQQGCPR
jgi:transaldolase